MRKFMSLVMIVVILVGTLWLSVGKVTAAGTVTYVGARFVWGKGVVFVFEASGYRNRDVKHASLSIGPDSFNVHCQVNKKAGKITCVAGSGLTRYAGQMGILSVAGHSFYVIIPDKPLLSFGDASISCPPGTEPGAKVTFFLPLDGPYTQFVSGSTLAEVQQNAQKIADDLGASITGIDNLVCR